MSTGRMVHLVVLGLSSQLQVQTQEQVPLSDKFRYDANHKDNAKINNMSV